MNHIFFHIFIFGDFPNFTMMHCESCLICSYWTRLTMRAVLNQGNFGWRNKILCWYVIFIMWVSTTSRLNIWWGGGIGSAMLRNCKLCVFTTDRKQLMIGRRLKDNNIYRVVNFEVFPTNSKHIILLRRMQNAQEMPTNCGTKVADAPDKCFWAGKLKCKSTEYLLWLHNAYQFKVLPHLLPFGRNLKGSIEASPTLWIGELVEI